VVPTRQVGTADTLSEQHIAIKNDSCAGLIKADVTGGMARRKQHAKLQLADLEELAVCKQDIRLRRWSDRYLPQVGAATSAK
jgi:hypothetical protein